MPFATISQSYEHTSVALHLQGEAQTPSSTSLSPEMISRGLQFRLEIKQAETLKIIQGDQSILLDLVQVLRRYLEFELRGQPQGTFSGTVAIRPLDFIFHRLTVRQGEGITQADLAMTQLYDLLEVLEDTAADLPQLAQLKAIKPRSSNLSPASIAALVVGGIGLAAGVAFLGVRGDDEGTSVMTTPLTEELTEDLARSSSPAQLESAAPADPPREEDSQDDSTPTPAEAPPEETQSLRQEDANQVGSTTTADSSGADSPVSQETPTDLSLAGQDLQINLATTWEAPEDLTEDLQYSVLVDPTGQILAASPENAAAADLQTSTPLEGIAATDPSPLPAGSEQFQVIFTAEGRVRVSPISDPPAEAAAEEQSE